MIFRTPRQSFKLATEGVRVSLRSVVSFSQPVDQVGVVLSKG